MEKQKQFGVAVIGLFMGRNMLYLNKHLDSDLFQSEVRAICDTNIERLTQNKEEFSIEFASTNYKDVIHRDDVDIVGIFSPDHFHMEMIREALEAGKHVICTKPLVISLEEAIETVNLVRKYKRKFLVGQTRRYVRHHMEAKALFDSGKLGDPLICEASYIHGDMWKVLDRGAWRYEAPQKMIYGGMCHPIDHLRWYFGDVDEVFAYGSPSPIDPRYPANELLNVMANLRFKNGIYGRIFQASGIIEPAYGSLSDVYPMEAVSIFGTKGTITNFHARYFEGDLRGEPTVVDFCMKENENDFDGKEYSGHLASVLRYVKELEDCIINDKIPLVNEIEGAKAISTGSAIEKSILSGKPEKVFNEF